MKKSGMGKRLFLFILTAAIILTMQGFPVLAGQVPLENGVENQPEQPTKQPEDEAETPAEQLEDGTEMPTEQPESKDEMPIEQLEDEDGSQEETPETSTEQPSLDNPEITTEEPGDSEVFEPAEADDNLMTEADDDLDGAVEASLGLDDRILKNHVVDSQNPGQAVVNLFDYCQYAGEFDGTKEEAHDWTDGTTTVLTYNLGISNGHLLRFGYREIGPGGTLTNCQYCYDNGNYGDWNEYKSGGPFPGIVQNELGNDGFPRLNFAGKESGFFENYGDPDINMRTESLAYLFSLNDNGYKKSYSNVQGLFQMDAQGYYYYDSKKNFAEFDESNKRFILYDSPGVGKEPDDPGAPASEGNYGQFFPFNKAEEVFDTEYTASDGEPYLLSYVGKNNNDPADKNKIPVDDGEGASFIKCYAPELNHYLGMTLEVPFLQPENGRLPDGTAMSFTFSGDDDVWIFIDGVLVADLGGLHDACSLSIDFSNGKVEVTGDASAHTLHDSFEKAYGVGQNPGGIAFNGDTFADNTVHTLKMFYLERGNIASNLSLKFNLQIARYNQLEKVDQNGNPIAGTAFELYPAAVCSKDDEGSLLCTSTVLGNSCYVKQSGDTPLLTIKTGAGGMADFIDQAGSGGYNFSSSSTDYYILHETAPPDGYRPQLVDIVLEYNPKTKMLSVANRWETGAYASFTSFVNEPAGTTMKYGEYDVNNGVVTPITSTVVDVNSQKSGLVLAVPMLRRDENSSSVWLPLYGSNLGGFHTTGDVGNTADSMERALLAAALNQCLYDEDWYLEWSEDKKGLEGRLSNLPGRADRYLQENKNGDMQMVYILIEPDAFKSIGISEGSSAARYAALKQYVTTNGVNAAVNAVYGNAGANVNLLYAEDFIRVFRSLIYISNEQRELRVMKVDTNGQPLNGAEFGLYASIEDAQRNSNAVSAGITANVDGVDGILIFKPQTDGGPGYARMAWENASNQMYYLKEISAPRGYKVNETIIPVVVSTYSIYADAGTENDGVSVMAGAGQLYQTMAKYAADDDVNITLRDITATAQRQDSGQFVSDGWQDVEESGRKQEKNLHYDMNREMGMDYGLHNEDSETTPFFRTDTGFLRVRVSQNTQALENEIYAGAVNIAGWDKLQDIDLTGLFSLLNVVVVEDQRTPDSDDGPENTETDTDTDIDTDMNTGISTEGLSKSLDVLADRIGTPQTGDDSLIWWWASLSGASLLGIGATTCNLILVKRKSKKSSSKGKQKKRSSKRKKKKCSSESKSE